MNKESFLKLFKFGIVGLIGVFIDFGTTFILKEILFVNKYLSNGTGFIIAATSNFVLNKWWTFKSQDSFYKEYLIFLTIALVGLCINTGILYLFHDKISIPFYAAKLLAVIIVFGWNYWMNNKFNFGRNNRINH